VSLFRNNVLHLIITVSNAIFANVAVEAVILMYKDSNINAAGCITTTLCFVRSISEDLSRSFSVISSHLADLPGWYIYSSSSSTSWSHCCILIRLYCVICFTLLCLQPHEDQGSLLFKRKGPLPTSQPSYYCIFIS
jgi:hypothetical protein